VLFLDTIGNVEGAQKVSELYGNLNFFYNLNSYDSFGLAVTALSDVNGDSIRDLAVSAFLDDDGGADAGAVYVLFLNSDDNVKTAQKVSMNHNNFGTFYTLDAKDGFGHSLESLGDIDSDGIIELIVGAYEDDDGGTDAGAVYTLFLDTTGNVTGAQKISALYGDLSSFYTLVAGDKFGNTIASLGDLDGDDEVDMAVGSYKDIDGGTRVSAVYVLFLKSNKHVKKAQKLSMLYGDLNVFYTLEAEDHFGSSVAALGDLNGDGAVDMAVGTVHDDDGGLNAGAVYVLFLASDGKIKNAQKISMLYGNFSSFYTLGAWDRLGHSAAALGDIDGDGVMDLAVGAYGDDDGVSGIGAVYVINLEQTYCETLVILQLRILIISFFSALLFFCA
jgi:hypothetical protein